MTALSAANERYSLDPLPSDLQLRVRGGQHGGRLIRLVGNKLTIGSAPNCSLRLLAPRIHPVHCLLVRGRQGTVIRRWNGDTRLNGESFSDAWLQAGDQLRLGSIELEVLADRSSSAFRQADERHETPQSSDEEGDPKESYPEVSSEQFQGRLQLLLEHQRILTERERDLEKQRAEFEFERQQWSRDREAELAELDARDICLRALRDEIEVARESYACDRHEHDRQWAEERERSLRELQQVRQERDELQIRLDERNRERRCDGETPYTASAASSESESLAAHCETVSESTVSVAPSTDLQQPVEPGTQPMAHPGLPHEADEFSIEDYMSQLLQRVGGRPAEPDLNGSLAPPSKPVVAEPRSEVKTPKPAEHVNDEPQLIPRAKPLPLDLVAMRDVANQTARLAIERHTSRLWLQAAIGKWFVVAVATISACGLVYWTARGKVLSGFGFFAACLVAIVWSAQAIWLTQRAVRVRLAERRGQESVGHELPSKADAKSESKSPSKA